jgi:Uma2 family endonuclease
MAMAISGPQYTVDDLDRFPDDGNRYELLDGQLLVTPAPSPAHQIVANRLQTLITAVLFDVAHVVGPGVVVRKPKTQLQPDVLVYSARISPRADWSEITGFWLAIEVLSRSSQVYDRDFKRDAYLAIGVEQVWLVDWRERCVDISRKPGESKRVRDSIRWRPPEGESVVISLNDVFAGLD